MFNVDSVESQFGFSPTSAKHSVGPVYYTLAGLRVVLHVLFFFMQDLRQFAPFGEAICAPPLLAGS